MKPKRLSSFLIMFYVNKHRKFRKIKGNFKKKKTTTSSQQFTVRINHQLDLTFV